MAQDIITLSELKTKARVTGSTSDTELTQIIAEVEGKFQGEIGQHLISTAYTEVRTGDGSQVLSLYRYPIITLTSIAIENEVGIAISNSEVRYGSEGVLYLINRYFTHDLPRNVTVIYTAGYATQAAVKAAMPDAWSCCLDASAQVWFDMKSREKGISSQAYMDGSISYFGVEFLSKKFIEGRWQPVVRKYARRWPAALAMVE
jgi:hypothetical protein